MRTVTGGGGVLTPEAPSGPTVTSSPPSPRRRRPSRASHSSLSASPRTSLPSVSCPCRPAGQSLLRDPVGQQVVAAADSLAVEDHPLHAVDPLRDLHELRRKGVPGHGLQDFARGRL